MTTSQLKEILKSNILTLATADKADPRAIEEHVQTGANLLLAPVCQHLNKEEEAMLDVIFEAASDKAFVAGQIPAPAEPLSDDECYQAYYEFVLRQAQWLEQMDVSMIFLTDFSDPISARCAVLAVREATPLPICAGIRLEDDEKSLRRGVSLLITLQALEVCAVGCTGMYIDDALHVLTELQAFATVPLFAISHPGQYLEPEDYGDYIPSFVHQKCAMIGLSAGRPAFSAAASKEIWQLSPLKPDFPVLNAICSQDEVMFLDFSGKIISQNKQLLEIKTEKGEELEQVLELVNRPGTGPVCFNIRDIDLLEYAITRYAGRPAVKSDEYGEITAKEFGALVLESETKE